MEQQIKKILKDKGIKLVFIAERVFPNANKKTAKVLLSRKLNNTPRSNGHYSLTENEKKIIFKIIAGY